MTSALRARLTLLVVLLILGIGLTAIGTIAGVTNDSPISESGAAFVVAEDAVAFERDDQRTTVLDNMTNVQSIEIEQQQSGVYKIQTDTSGPLTDRERKLAKEIVRDHGNVRDALLNLNQYELSVEPIHKLTVGSSQTTSFSSLDKTSKAGEKTGGEETFSIRVEDSDQTGTVTIDRDPSYIQNEAVVRIRDVASGEMYYSVTVDIVNETVIDIDEGRKLDSQHDISG